MDGGPLDPPGATVDELEAWGAPQNAAFVAGLDALDIPATIDTGAGTHTWPYWERALHEAMPLLLGALGPD